MRKEMRLHRCAEGGKEASKTHTHTEREREKQQQRGFQGTESTAERASKTHRDTHRD